MKNILSDKSLKEASKAFRRVDEAFANFGRSNEAFLKDFAEKLNKALKPYRDKNNKPSL